MKKLYVLIFTGMLFFTTIGVGAASAQYYQGRLSIPGGGSSDMTGSRMKVNATNNGKMSGVTSAWLGAYGRICHSAGNPAARQGQKKLNSSLQPLDIDQGVYLTGSLFRGRVFSQGAEPNNITVDVQFTPW